MKFWKILRWSSAILFVAMVLLAWATSSQRGAIYEDDDTPKATPIIR